MRSTARRSLALLLIFVMLLGACQPASPTPTVTVRPPATATTEATEEAAATEEATEAATEPTEEATIEATEEAATEEATEVAMLATTEATEEATLEATEEVELLDVTSEATVEVMELPTDEATVEATVEATEVATEEATVEATVEVTEAATEEATVEATIEATEEATATVEPTEAPTAEATVEATEEATAEATLEAEVTPEATAELGTIAEVAAEGEDFSILLAAIEAADLTDALNGDGPLTVLAPTNEAFEKLFEELNITQEDLLASDDLANILLYHVLTGDVPADTLVTLIGRQSDDELTVETMLEDETLVFTLNEDGEVIVNGTAKVEIADVPATNGVIHVIDTVLIPAGITLGE